MKALVTVFGLLLVISFTLPVARNIERESIDIVHDALPEGQIADLPEGKVFYELSGDPQGPLVVLVHGFSVPSYTWEANVVALNQAGYRALRYDLYGRGYSARPDTDYDRALFVAQLHDLLETLQINGQVHLVGLSMGGAIVAAFAADYPQKAASLTLLAPFNQPIDIAPMHMPVLGELVAYGFFVPALPGRQAEAWVDPKRGGAWASLFTEQMQYEGFRYALLSSARHFLQHDPAKDFAQVGKQDMPKMLIWGDQDTTFPLAQSESVKKALGPDHEFVVVPDAGHALQVERAEKVNAALLAFLDKAEAREAEETRLSMTR